MDSPNNILDYIIYKYLGIPKNYQFTPENLLR